MFDIIREEQREDDVLAAIISLLLLGGGSQGAAGTQAISLDNPATALLLFEALSHDRHRRDIIPLLIAISGAQGAGTQANTLLPLVILTATRRPIRHEIAELERHPRDTRSELSELSSALTELLREAKNALKTAAAQSSTI